MSAVAKIKLTEAEYLANEAVSEFRSEFYAGEAFAMVGRSPAHNQIKENFAGELYSKLKGGPCRTRSSDQRVKVEATGLYTYPDIAVICDEPQYAKSDPHSLINPQILIEILSTSTESYDRIEKFRHYQKIPTLREYLLVAQDRIAIEHFVKNEKGDWAFFAFTSENEEFAFATMPVRLKIADLFVGVVFPPRQEMPRAAISNGAHERT